MEVNEKQDKDIQDLRAEIRAAKDEHKTLVTWTTYWAITLVMIGLTTGAVSFIMREKSSAHIIINDRLTKLESGDNSYERRLVILEERYNNIVSGINELKVILKEHDK